MESRARRRRNWVSAKKKQPRTLRPGLMEPTLAESVRSEAISFKDPCTYSIDDRWDRLMGDSFDNINSDCGFCRIVRANRDTNTLNSRLAHQAAYASFLDNRGTVNFLRSD